MSSKKNNRAKPKRNYSPKTVYLHETDFVKEQIDHDVLVIINCAQAAIEERWEKIILGGKDIDEFLDDVIAFCLKSPVGIKDVRSYAVNRLNDSYDAPRLLKSGKVSYYQLVFLHRCLMRYLERRFEEYRYRPPKKNYHNYQVGASLHRGYDYLLSITLLFELQFGMHLVLNDKIDIKRAHEFGEIRELLGWCMIPNDHFGLVVLIADYFAVLSKIGKIYNRKEELEDLRKRGLAEDKECAAQNRFFEYEQLRKSVLVRIRSNRSDLTRYFQLNDNWREALKKNNSEQQRASQEFNSFVEEIMKHRDDSDTGMVKTDDLLIDYYRSLVISMTFNTSGGVFAPLHPLLAGAASFPQRDFYKMHQGMEKVCFLFQEGEKLSFDNKEQETKIKRLYHESVFYLLDECNLFSIYENLEANGFEYIDDVPMGKDELNIIEDDEKEITFFPYNPAAKTTRAYPVRHLRAELMQLLQGKSISLHDGNEKVIARFPIIPYFGSVEQGAAYLKDYDGTSKDPSLLLSEEFADRAEFLGMEIRVKEITPNSVVEFLNPFIFNKWLHEKQLLSETRAQNAQLKKANEELEQKRRELAKKNERLKKTLEINNNLVSEISHSSANLLAPKMLEGTGKVLYFATEASPTLSVIHEKGFDLFAHASREQYLVRRLNDLSVRSVSGRDGYFRIMLESVTDNTDDASACMIETVVDDALSLILKSLLFDSGENRSDKIRNKLHWDDSRVTDLRADYINELVFTQNQTTSVLEWFSNNIMPVRLSVDEEWHILAFFKQKAMYNLLLSVLFELLYNAVTYSDGEIALELGIMVDRNEIRGRTIICENRYSNNVTVGTRRGLESMNNILIELNDTCRISEEKAFSILDTGDLFRVTANIPYDIM